MKHKLLNTVFAAYLVFLLVSFILAFVLVPRFLQHYLYQISDDPQYLQYLHSQSIAIQNVCSRSFRSLSFTCGCTAR